MTAVDTRAEFIADLRAFADLLERRPDMPIGDYDTVRVPIDPNIHAWAASAFSYVLRGQRDMARVYIKRLDDGQRDWLMTAGAILVAITGGVSEEALVAEAALSPDGIGGHGA